MHDPVLLLRADTHISASSATNALEEPHNYSVLEKAEMVFFNPRSLECLGNTGKNCTVIFFFSL